MQGLKKYGANLKKRSLNQDNTFKKLASHTKKIN